MYGLGSGSGGGFNVWVWIILILIVLQWFRVGSGFDVGIGPGPGVPGIQGGIVSPEMGLVNNGGLFIIALFILLACSCFKSPIIIPQPISPIRCC